MFTGLVEAKAKVFRLESRRGGKRLWLDVPVSWARIPLGASVAVDGACLTVCARQKGQLAFDLLRETLKRTRFGSLKGGESLNMERALRAKQRIEGHFVQGHVDGVGKVRRVVPGRREKSLFVSFPSTLASYIIPKGSIAVNGVSLTVGKVRKGSFSAHLIPHTLRGTNLGALREGDRVHLEADALLKFFHRLTRPKGHYKLIRHEEI